MKSDRSLRVPAVVVTIVCIFILIVELYLKSKYNNAIMSTIVYPLIEMLCSLTITAAIGTYFIEWKGFIDYVKKSLAEVLSHPSMVTNLDYGYQSDLAVRLVGELTHTKDEKIGGFVSYLLSIIQKQSRDYGFYLIEQSNSVICELYKDNNKNVILDSNNTQYRRLLHTRTITYGKLRDGDVEITELLSVNTLDTQLFNGEKTVQVVSVSVNSRRLKPNEFIVSIHDNSLLERIDTTYKKNYMCTLSTPLKIQDSTKVVLEYITIEPVSDCSYCTRMKHLCNRFVMDFFYDPDSFEVHGQALSFGERKNQHMRSNSLHFDIDNWLLPGEGTNVFIGVK